MKLIKALSFLIVILVIINVTLTNKNVDDSWLVSNLEKDIKTLQDENTIFRGQVASAGSLGSLALKIEEAGFVESPSIVSVPSSISVASR